MEELVLEVVKESKGSDLIWALIVWTLAREIIPSVVKKLRNGKTPFMETIKVKIDYLYSREKDRAAVEKHEHTLHNRRASD